MSARLLPLALLLLGAVTTACDDGEAEPTPDTSPVPTPDAAADSQPEDDMAPTPDAAPDAAVDMAAAPDAGPPAPAPLGYLAESITYAPAGDDADRTLPIFWWYPTADESGAGVAYRGAFPGERVYDGAAPALDAPAPLIVFSHGRSGFGQYSFFLTEYFARRGFVALAVDHIGDTLTDAVDSPGIYRQRPQDIAAIIDHAFDPGADHPLAGLVGGPVVLVGHSFGGYTALAVGGAAYASETFAAACPGADGPFCEGFLQTPELYSAGFRDPRVELIVPLAPGNYSLFAEGLAAVDVPVLLMTGARDRNTPDASEGDPIWAALPDDGRHRRVSFATGGHFTFTSICRIVGPLGVDNGCSEGDIPVDIAHPIINRSVEAFIDRHLLGGADPEGDRWLDGEAQPHPDVTIVQKPVDQEEAP